MSEHFYGNKKACSILEKYMEHGCTGNLVLSGPKGVGKGMLAKKIAAQILGCEIRDLKLHPDFVFLEPENRQIKTEMLQEVLERCRYKAAAAERKVVLIDDADCMNASAQNRLLKEIEEYNRYSSFIFVNHGRLLDTIKSRCFVVNFERIDSGEMLRFFAEAGEQDAAEYLPVCNGSIGDYFVYKNSPELMESVKKIIRHFSESSCRSQILAVCGQIKEKDRESVYERFGRQMEPFFQLFEAVFYGLFLHMTTGISPENSFMDYSNMEKNYSIGLVISILDQIKQHASMYKRGMYTKNDFFKLLRLMA